jgi:high-affinity iron transporter
VGSSGSTGSSGTPGPSDAGESTLAAGFDFAQSLTIILREGVEAALLLTLLLAFASSAGQGWARRYIWGGALAGIAAGGFTWVVARNLLEISSLNREALEGVVSILAALVLFSVCLWIIHHADVEQWKKIMRRQAANAAGGRGGLALAVTAFLAVYREAFETVLFYQALWLRSGSSGGSIVLGFALGSLGLVIVCTLLFRFGVRLALKPFFTVTGWLLTLLAVTFAGAGVRALQLVGWVPETFLPWDLRIPLLEVYPTAETLGLQISIVLAILLGYLAMRQQTRAAAAARAVEA